MPGYIDSPGVPAPRTVTAICPLPPLGDAGADVLARLSRMAAGTVVNATLLSRFDDDSFEVSIAGGSLRMSLPAGAQVGERLSLLLVAAQPRATFLLQAGTAASATPGGPALSDSARLVDALLRPAAGLDSAMQVVTSRVPLLRAAPGTDATDLRQLATALQTALGFSGVFYESHVAQWANGTRPLAALLQEPQAKMAAIPALSLNGPAIDSVIESGPGVSRAAAPTAASTGAPASASTAPAQTASLQHEALRGDAGRMIRLQLETLEHQQIRWRGEAWPGQSIEWAVAAGKPEAVASQGLHVTANAVLGEHPSGNASEHAPEHADDHAPDADNGNSGSSEERAWQSVLTCNFARLGKVTATLDLRGDLVRIRLCADSHAPVLAMQSNAKELAAAIQRNGTSLAQFSIRQEDPQYSQSNAATGSRT